MASNLFFLPSQVVQSNRGLPSGAALVFFFYTGTTTKAPTFSDSGLTMPADNPAVADAFGRIAPTYLEASVTYRIRVVDARGVPIGDDVDPYIPGSINGLISVQEGTGKVLSLDEDGNPVLTDLSSLPIGLVQDSVGTGTNVAPSQRAVGSALAAIPGTSIAQIATVHFYADEGAKISRLNDRAFGGDATKNAGTNAGSQPDWLTTYLLSRGRSFAFQQVSQWAVTTQNNSSAANAFLGGAHTAPFTSIGNAIGVLGVAVNDNPNQPTGAYGGYLEGFQQPGAMGPCFGAEIDTINFNAAVQIDPYQQASTQVVGLQLANGAEFDPAILFDASAAINVRNNGASYQRGIVFGDTALSGCNGVIGTAVAVAMAKGHGLAWYSAAGVPTSQIYGLSVDPGKATVQAFKDGSITFSNAVSGKNVFVVNNQSTATVNYLATTPSVAGAPVQVAAQGDDANIGVQLTPKGSAAVMIPLDNIQPFTNDAAAAAGSVPVGGFYRIGSAVQIRVS